MLALSSAYQAALKILLVIVFLALLPFILVFWIVITALWGLTSFVLYILVWVLWRTRGKDILFVYSDSPIWHDYIEEHIIPRIKTRAVILNWSNRRHWRRRWSLSTVLFRHFGGHREYNPLAIYFPPLWFHRSFRFLKAFKDWKHGKSASLKQVEDDFFRCIG